MTHPTKQKCSICESPDHTHLHCYGTDAQRSITSNEQDHWRGQAIHWESEEKKRQAQIERLRAALTSIGNYPGLPAVIYGVTSSALSGNSPAPETRVPHELVERLRDSRLLGQEGIREDAAQMIEQLLNERDSWAKTAGGLAGDLEARSERSAQETPRERLRDSDAAFNLGVLPTEQPEKATVRHLPTCNLNYIDGIGEVCDYGAENGLANATISNRGESK